MLQKRHLLLLIIPAIYGVWIEIIYLYGINIPILDQWIAPGEQIESFFLNSLDFAGLDRQYNESRMLFPNLLFVVLAKILKEWNVKAEMFMGIALSFLMILIIYSLLLLTNKSFYKNIFIITGYNLLLLSPSSFSRWLRGITIHRLISDACIITNALIFRLNINSTLKILLYSISCIVAQYSFSGGIMTWIVSLIFIIYNNNVALVEKLKSTFLFVTLFLISSFFYFIEYNHPSYIPKPIEILSFSIEDIIFYFFSFIGNIFGSSYESNAVIGIFIVMAFSILLIVNLNYVREQVLIPWIGIGIYTIGLGILNTITRLQISYNQATRSDYLTHLVYLPLSIIVLFFFLIEFKRNQVKKWVSLSFIGMMSVLYINKNFQPHLLVEIQEWYNRYSYGKSCIQLINFYQKDDCIKVLFPFIGSPFPWKLELIVQRFNQLSSLNVLKPGMLKEIKINSHGEWGYIDSIKEDKINGSFEIDGWAKILNRPADAVLLAYKSEEQDVIIDILPTGEMRTDVSQKHGWKYINSGWSGNISLKNRVSNLSLCHLKAYGFDANENILYPLKSFCS